MSNIARIYCRISEEDKTKPDTSISNQKAIGMRICMDIGAELDSKKPFYIAINEKSWQPLAERKVLSEAYNDAINKQYQILIIKDWSRFARGRTQETLEFKFKEAGIKIIPGSGSTDEIGKDAISFANSIIVKENRRKANEMIKMKMADGLPITRPPFGYKLNKIKKKIGNRTIISTDKKWHVDEKHATIVHQIFELLSKRVNVKNIAAIINMYPRKIYRIKDDLAYIGYVSYIKRIRDPDGNLIRTENVIYKGIHEPIISEELWLKVHKKLPEITQQIS